MKILAAYVWIQYKLIFHKHFLREFFFDAVIGRKK